MIPLIISGVASVANTVLENWNRASEARAAAQVQPRVDFDSLMKSKSVAGAAGVTQAQTAAPAGALMRQLLQTPEVSSALNGRNLPGTSIQIGAGGEVSLHFADGHTQAVKVSPQTQALALQARTAISNAQG
jgi:hypothetical protein